jgi:hypothetical protein
VGTASMPFRRPIHVPGQHIRPSLSCALLPRLRFAVSRASSFFHTSLNPLREKPIKRDMGE